MSLSNVLPTTHPPGPDSIDPVHVRQAPRCEIGVVVPVYRAQDSLVELHERLTQTLTSLGRSYELVFVEDCGGDDSWRVIESLARDPHVRAVKLSRNFGQHFAITAGLDHVDAQWVVVMDADLQDEPENIPKMYRVATEQGFDIVMTRSIAKKHAVWRRVASRLWAKGLSFLSGAAIDSRACTLSLISRKVVLAFRELRDAHRHYLLLLGWLGFRRCYMDVEHKDRPHGRSTYSLAKLVGHAIDGVISQSSRLLSVSIFFGVAITVLSLILGLAVVVQVLALRAGVPGWPSVICVLLFLGGSLHMAIGVAGLYLGRTLDQSRQRPLYVVDETLNMQLRVSI